MDDNFEKPINEQEPITEPKKNEDNTAWYIVIGIAIIAFFVYLLSLFKLGEKRKRTRTPDKVQKEEILKSYGVNKRTLGKWVMLFCDPSVLSYETYNKRRRLTGEEYFYLLSRLGLNTDETPVMTKVEIAGATNNHTNTLRNWVIQNIHEFDFPIETYDALNIFPPLIAHQILTSFNRTIV
jgi:heme/copper-type cytochrome/quinol oxidase subunit 2